MSKFDERIVTKRFVEIIDDLRRNGSIKSDSEFCKKVNLMKQSLSSMRKGKRKITITLVIKIYEHYKGNPFYILFGVGQKILSQDIFEYIKSSDPPPIDERLKTLDRLERLLNESISLHRELIRQLKDRLG